MTDPLASLPPSAAAPQWTLSVVSHGHLPQIRSLIEDLRHCLEVTTTELIVTLNIPEDAAGLAGRWPGPFRLIRNAHPRGFGANHNAALRQARGRYLALLDPDLRVRADPLPALRAALQDPGCGIVAAMVLDEHERISDHARRAPTLRRLLMRRLRPDAAPYAPTLSQPVEVDWVAGLFMAMRADTFARLEGFDEGFHMYCEDVDLCLRSWNSGLAVRVIPTPPLIHPARRQTLKHWRHFAWHCHSLLRLLASRTYREFLRRCRAPVSTPRPQI